MATKTATKPKATDVADTMNLCFCGCGGQRNPKSFFLPGHDSRLVSQVMKGEKPIGVLDMFPKLLEKYGFRMDKRETAKETVEQKAAVKVVKDKLYEMNDGTNGSRKEVTPTKCQVKVGRWWREGRVIAEITNSAGEVVGYQVQHVVAKDAKDTRLAMFTADKVDFQV